MITAKSQYYLPYIKKKKILKIKIFLHEYKFKLFLLKKFNQCSLFSAIIQPKLYAFLDSNT